MLSVMTYIFVYFTFSTSITLQLVLPKSNFVS